MELTEVRNPNELNAFAANLSRPQFNQSWQWGDIEKEEGHHVWRLAIRDNGKIVATAQIVSRALPLGFSYLYCPRGPIFSDNLSAEDRREVLTMILGAARHIAETTPKIELCVRLEPPLPMSTSGQLRSLDLVTTNGIQPQHTQIIDLSLEDLQLLSQMHPKTRYNIGLAERHGIKVWREEDSAKGMEAFASLLKLTAQRHNFKIHSLAHYHRIIRTLDGENGAPAAELWLAGIKDEQPLAAAISIKWGNTSTYLHGASDPAFKHLMAPNLMQWQMMKNAKALGYKYYDFWGIAPADQPKHPWAGFTRFKQGFGGQAVEFVGAWDFVQQPGWYNLYRLYQHLRGRK